MFAHSNNTSFSIGMTNATTIDPAGFTSITQQLVVDTGGYVGINTTSPSERLHVVGNVLATAYLYISDRRLKKDIESITGSGAESALDRLQGVRFKWKSDDRSDIGFIAQDVEKVLPELVHTDKAGMKSVQYGNIIPLLVEGYKSQKARADNLQTRLNSLESRLEKLEKSNQ